MERVPEFSVTTASTVRPVEVLISFAGKKKHRPGDQTMNNAAISPNYTPDHTGKPPLEHP
jgi:hypothetical protein